MAFLMTEEAILERYRSKITPEGRRECIRQLADENKVAPYIIAEFLRDNGCVVDGRLIRKIKPDLNEPGWEPYTFRDGRKKTTKTAGPSATEEAPAAVQVAIPEAGADMRVEPGAITTEGPEPEITVLPDLCEEEGARPMGMTVGTLRDLLDGVMKEARVVTNASVMKDGAPIRGLTMTAHFSANGERESCVVTLEV